MFCKYFKIYSGVKKKSIYKWVHGATIQHIIGNCQQTTIKSDKLLIIASLLSRLLTPRGNELFQNLHKYKTDNAKVRDLSSSQTPSTPLSNTHTQTRKHSPPPTSWCLLAELSEELNWYFLIFFSFLTLSFCPSYSVFLSFSCACACVHFCSGAKACVSACFHGKRIRAWVPLNETEAEATAHSVAMR